MPSTEKTGFQGLRVVSFESRYSREMAELITGQGGQALVVPSMRPVALSDNQELAAFAEKLAIGAVDTLVCMTGIGTKVLLEELEKRPDTRPVPAVLSHIRVVARGPKPYEALKEAGVELVTLVPDPATWREVFDVLDAPGSFQGRTIAIQESGAASRELIEALSTRGARVLRVPVYRWALPEDTGPLRDAIHAVAEGRADVVLFTNSTQIDHVLRLAQEEGVENEFREGLAQAVVASVGPVCSEFLDEYGLPVDLEPEQPKMTELIAEASRRSSAILASKRFSAVVGGEPTAPRETPQGMTSELHQSLFLKACRREATSATPIWLMRQAGRYMKEYRDIRARHSFLDLCKDSDLACEVSVYAVERLGVDAAIIFSDILVILEPMGLTLEYAKGEGPLIHNPVRESTDLERVRRLEDPAALGFVYDAIRKTRAALPRHIPLIGFAGAPFTLASYMIEGQGSRNFIHTKSLMYRAPDAWAQLMEHISDSLISYLNAQIAAGAQAVQLFDSWVGCLSPQDYRRFVLPFSRRVIRGITPGTPMIHFGTQTGTLLELLREAGGDVIGLDWRVELDDAWKKLGAVGVQGNLDPVVLFSDPVEIRRQAKRILDQAGGRPGHIFNLGHGVLPHTPVGHVKALVDAVHEMSAR